MVTEKLEGGKVVVKESLVAWGVREDSRIEQILTNLFKD